jgi:AcrR family transcriptional regulator
LTARARIRDAAIERFAEEGFDASFRSIAERAGVSPGLITHHFGSKAGLRAECDAEVLRRYRAVKSDGLARPSAHLLESLTAPGVSATILAYMLRAIHAGGRSAHEFLEHLIDDMRPVMAQGVETGLVRPSRDEEARLRYLTYQTMGAMVVLFVTTPGATPEQFVASLRAGAQETILPMLELLTEGLLADRQMLDDYLEFLWEPPDGAQALVRLYKALGGGWTPAPVAEASARPQSEES